MTAYQCSRCNHKFTASNPTQCPNCLRTTEPLPNTSRPDDEVQFWLTTFILIAATDEPTTSYSTSCNSYDSDSSSYSDSYSGSDSCSSSD